MRYMTRVFITAAMVGFFLGFNGAHAQPERGGDKTLSPYFFVKSDDPELDQLPLKSTSVLVNISGIIADVLVTQVYRNEGKRPLEAIYIFPASTRAAVYGMKMRIGDRTITAKIDRREDARRQYEEAKEAGKSASLLEQQRPNVFQMNVANILPSDVIKVELRYTELLVPTDAVYGFVYPTVVGPRYTNQLEEEASQSDLWTKNPYLHQAESPPYTFSIDVNIAAGLPIKDVSCPSHKINVNYERPSFSAIRLHPSEKYGGNRDFILNYRLAGGRIETGLLLYEGEAENFFLLMLQPPKRVHERLIPPREYIFIVDVSGSMHGFPLNISKKLLRDLIGKLRPVDRFNVLLFAGGSSLMSNHSLPATPENIRRAIDIIERQRGGGGTELLPALRRGLLLPKTEGYSRSIIIATDGYVSVEAEAFDLIRKNLGNANIFPFGIGSSVNRHIIEGMARVGMGEPFIITKPEEAPEKARKFMELIKSPVLTGIEVDFGQFQVYDVEPASIPDVLANRPVIVFGKWRGKARGHIELRGITGAVPFSKRIEVEEFKPSESSLALRYLWARHRITLLSDYNKLSPQDERVREVTNLGLTYNLLTAYTSFVAVDSQVRLTNGESVLVKQPLPLPYGVSDYAVGDRQYARKAAPHLAIAPSMTGKGNGYSQRWSTCKEEELAPEPKGQAGYSWKNRLLVKQITVSSGLTADLVEKEIEKNIASIKTCCKTFPGPQSRPSGEITFKLVVDPDGCVTQVTMEKEVDNYKDFERCMIERLKALQFPARAETKKVQITITFILT
jgi:Ca-activated chloride channel family protein